MDAFSVTTTRDAAGHVVIAVSGELDLAAADRLWSALAPQLTPGSLVVLDCAQMGFMDSSGLRVLLRASKHAAETGAGFRVAAIQPDVARVLELTGVIGLFTLYDDAAQALAD